MATIYGLPAIPGIYRCRYSAKCFDILVEVTENDNVYRIWQPAEPNYGPRFDCLTVDEWCALYTRITLVLRKQEE